MSESDCDASSSSDSQGNVSTPDRHNNKQKADKLKISSDNESDPEVKSIEDKNEQSTNEKKSKRKSHIDGTDDDDDDEAGCPPKKKHKADKVPADTPRVKAKHNKRSADTNVNTAKAAAQKMPCARSSNNEESDNESLQNLHTNSAVNERKSDNSDESDGKISSNEEENSQSAKNTLNKSDNASSDSDGVSSDNKNTKSSDKLEKSPNTSDSETNNSDDEKSENTKKKKLSKKTSKIIKKKDVNSDSGNSSESESDDKADDTTGKVKKSQVPPEQDEQIIRLKKYLNLCGMRFTNYNKLWEKCKTNRARAQKLLDILHEKGINGRPTNEKCKKLRKKLETAREIADLDVSNIVSTGGRSTRYSKLNTQYSSIRSPVKNIENRKVFSRIQTLVDSDSD